MDWLSGISAALGAFFVFGSFWFWVIVAAVFGLVTFWTEKERDFLSLFVLGAVIWTIASVNELPSITAEPLVWLTYGGYYLAAGIVWSFFKWFSHLHRVKDTLRNLKQQYLNKSPNVTLRDNGTFNDTDFKDFAKFLNDNYEWNRNNSTVRTRADVEPSVAEYRYELTRWIAWWPFSAFWTILNDPLRRLANFIVNRLRGIYESMASRVFKNEV